MFTQAFLIALILLVVAVILVYKFLPDPWNILLSGVIVVLFVFQYLL